MCIYNYILSSFLPFYMGKKQQTMWFLNELWYTNAQKLTKINVVDSEITEKKKKKSGIYRTI